MKGSKTKGKYIIIHDRFMCFNSGNNLLATAKEMTGSQASPHDSTRLQQGGMEDKPRFIEGLVRFPTAIEEAKVCRKSRQN